MNTYIFAERNSGASLTLSAENYHDAWEILGGIVIECAEWRLEHIEREEDGSIRQANRDAHAESYPEDARARTFDGGF